MPLVHPLDALSISRPRNRHASRTGAWRFRCSAPPSLRPCQYPAELDFMPVAYLHQRTGIDCLIMDLPCFARWPKGFSAPAQSRWARDSNILSASGGGPAILWVLLHIGPCPHGRFELCVDAPSRRCSPAAARCVERDRPCSSHMARRRSQVVAYQAEASTPS